LYSIDVVIFYSPLPGILLRMDMKKELWKELCAEFRKRREESKQKRQ
jgi:hypothetical protein